MIIFAPPCLVASESSGLDGDPNCWPRAQAAAWGLCGRATSEKLDSLNFGAECAAAHDGPLTPGPLYVRFGVIGGDSCDRILTELRATHRLASEVPVRITAILVEKAAGTSLDVRNEILLRVADGGVLETLHPDE
ncbi:hypothetical protein GDI2831 [Gluconacetobacter diazotrophicus PA1 5]|uniref:Uncharacterized protein n=1 Tax=Gluconacetobacter diazotrophicus (strain ATCC 49037 / DSM 5601 / CCUG 37298 / CIP 103539 / LMG 7603 / PAl5) TaxID=272568 RepID=A9HQP5_GLUDA|nr:hypothetical protein GDI2831 [Gluconacetobacter diazotrophicus PA1 5]